MTAFFLRRPVSLFCVYAIIFVLGIISLLRLPIELYPETSYPELSINVDWYGASPEAVEKNITRKIEGAIFTLKGVRNVESRSQRERCEIDVEFERNVDMDYQRVLLSEALSNIELPKGTRPPSVEEFSPEEFKKGVPFVISVSGTYSREKMKIFGKWLNILHKVA